MDRSSLPSGYKARINHFLIADLFEVGREMVFGRARLAGSFVDYGLRAVRVGRSGLPRAGVQERLAAWHTVFAAPHYHGLVRPVLPVLVEPILPGQVESATGVALPEFTEDDYILVSTWDDMPESVPPPSTALRAMEVRACLERLHRVTHFLDFVRSAGLDLAGPVRNSVVLDAGPVILYYPAFLPLPRAGSDAVAGAGAATVASNSEEDRCMAIAACAIDAVAPSERVRSLGELRLLTPAGIQAACAALNPDQCALLHRTFLTGAQGTMSCSELVHGLLYLDACGRSSGSPRLPWWRRPVPELGWLPAVGVAAGLAALLAIGFLLLKIPG